MLRRLTLGIAVALLAMPALAQEKPERQRISRPGRTPQEEADGATGDRRAKGSVASMFERARAVLELDDAQSEQFDALVSAARQKLAAGRKTSQEGGERSESVQDVMDEFYDSVAKILRPDQEVKLDRLRSADQLQTQSRKPDTKAFLKRLRQQLGLSDDQQAKWDALYADLEQKQQGRQTPDAETMELIDQLREAIANNDTAKIEEIRGQFKNKQGSPETAMNEFLDQVNEFLSPTQQHQLASARERFASNQTKQAVDVDARTLLALTRRIDLTPEQKAQIREIERSWREQSRAARRDREALVALDNDVKTQIRGVLTEAQNAELDELAAREGGRSTPRRRAARSPDQP